MKWAAILFFSCRLLNSFFSCRREQRLMSRSQKKSCKPKPRHHLPCVSQMGLYACDHEKIFFSLEAFSFSLLCKGDFCCLICPEQIIWVSYLFGKFHFGLRLLFFVFIANEWFTSSKGILCTFGNDIFLHMILLVLPSGSRSPCHKGLFYGLYFAMLRIFLPSTTAVLDLELFDGKTTAHIIASIPYSCKKL